ncbi:hypothetical protein R1sor_019761 [Riccia sorocarpa]|uniref:DUF4057 domain-containing protein n=1 Tax=Riccia sorocarpa TaxID=122646 RepID=A0ABD3IF41_9MARC
MPVENSPASATRRASTPPGGPSTFDLFSWSEGPDATQTTPVRHSVRNDSAAFVAANDESVINTPSRPTIRMHQPAGGASSFAFGEQMTPEESEALVKRRPGSEVKRKEMFGSGIFMDGSENGDQADRTCVRLHQPAGGVSQIQFGGEELTSPKKPTSVPEVAKQRELSGSTETTLDLKHRNFSNAKAKELTGSNIFGPAPPDAPPRRAATEVREQQKDGLAEGPPRNHRTCVKVSNPAGGRSQIAFGHDEAQNSARKVDPHKIAELSGNNIFSDDPQTPVSEAHHHLSSMKLREMSGSDIFKDEKPVIKDHIGGIRKPPGGGSTIALV